MVRPTNKTHTIGPELPLTAKMPNLDYKALNKVCQLGEKAIAKKYGLKYTHTTDGGFWFKDNGAKILAVAHLDTVQPYTHFTVARMRHDSKIYCPTLDDRLGAYIILEYLPKAGVECDILLTTNEEKGRSTARSFRTDKQYDWMFMFDRTGDGAVVYNYGDAYDKNSPGWSLALEDAGLRPTYGLSSCIKNLEFLGCKGVNIGCGYYNYHDREAYCRRNVLMSQLNLFLTFYEENAGIYYPHIYIPPKQYKTYPASNYKTKHEKLFDKVNQRKSAKEEKEEDERIQRLVATIKNSQGGTWKMKKNILQQDVTFLSISNDLAQKLIDSQIFYIGELARMSWVEILNLQGLTKEEADRIKVALALVDLSTSTRLADYGLMAFQGMIGELVNSSERAAALLLTPPAVTKDKQPLVQIDKKAISYKAPPSGVGEISFSIPLIRGDKAQLYRNKDGEVTWTQPLPQRDIGFQASREIEFSKKQV